jgi:hypothetical protein
MQMPMRSRNLVGSYCRFSKPVENDHTTNAAVASEGERQQPDHMRVSLPGRRRDFSVSKKRRRTPASGGTKRGVHRPYDSQIISPLGD